MAADTRPARAFWQAVRSFALRAASRPWLDALVYDTQPDERTDATLISARVYGRRDEYLAVMAAAGVSTTAEPITERRLYLPTESRLSELKRATGFESRADLLDDGVPVWADSA